MPWAGAVEQIRNGNESGADSLYEAVTQCARAQLFQSIDPQAVDDHVQEVLMIVRAAIQSGELRNPECLMGFVRTVTRRQVTGHIRGSIVRRRRLVSVEASETPLASLLESPEALLAQRQRIAAASAVLATLCPRDREILVRFYYMEQDSLRICREMQLTSTQFRLYKSRALAKCGDRSTTRRIPSTPQSTRPLRIA